MDNRREKMNTLRSFFSCRIIDRQNRSLCFARFTAKAPSLYHNLKVVPLSVFVNKHLPRQRVKILPPQPIHKNALAKARVFLLDNLRKKNAHLVQFLYAKNQKLGFSYLFSDPSIFYPNRKCTKRVLSFAGPNSLRNAKLTSHPISLFGLSSLRTAPRPINANIISCRQARRAEKE